MRRRTSEPVVSMSAAVDSAREILSRWFKRGKLDFSTEHLRDSLAENGSFVDAVMARLTEEGLIELTKTELPPGTLQEMAGLLETTYRISSGVLDEIAKSYLGLQIDETLATIQRPEFCRHVVSLSPVQLQIAIAICKGGEQGITASAATQLRGGERTGERQFRTAFNRCLSLLEVKLDRFAWKIVDK